MKTLLIIAVLAGALVTLPARAQDAEPPAPAPAFEPLSDQQLDQLLGPIALYPDPLIAEILPASTLPTQIVMADRYLQGGGDTNAIDQQPWDASVQALARYPAVLQWMDDNLPWTTELGQAFLNQQQGVMDSVQRLRATAQNLGNLQSTPQQQVVDDDGTIDIMPANPDIMYVPVYQPDQVYYQTGFGEPFVSFGIGLVIGDWLHCDFDWHHHNVVVWDHDHPRPHNWWHARPEERTTYFARQPKVWHPENRGRPVTVNRGDRGWATQPAPRPMATVIGRPEPREAVHPRQSAPTFSPPRNTGVGAAPRPAPAPVQRPAPAPVQRPAPAPVQRPAPEPHMAAPSRPASTGAFIGVQSSQQTHEFSSRGQESMGSVSHGKR